MWPFGTFGEMMDLDNSCIWWYAGSNDLADLLKLCIWWNEKTDDELEKNDSMPVAIEFILGHCHAQRESTSFIFGKGGEDLKYCFAKLASKIKMHGRSNILDWESLKLLVRRGSTGASFPKAVALLATRVASGGRARGAWKTNSDQKPGPDQNIKADGRFWGALLQKKIEKWYGFVFWSSQSTIKYDKK